MRRRVGSHNLLLSGRSTSTRHIAAAHVFLTAWGHERWDELLGIAADAVTVRFEDRVFNLEPAVRKSEMRLVFRPSPGGCARRGSDDCSSG
jgi:hypothetical protein